MKFGKSLRQMAVPEWLHAYVDYKGLKQFIKTLETRVGGPDVRSASQLSQRPPAECSNHATLCSATRHRFTRSS